jgi:hypothetical protein
VPERPLWRKADIPEYLQDFHKIDQLGTAAFRPEADIKLILVKRSANDPKRPSSRGEEPMSNMQSIQWGRLSAEGVAIIVSILLAFGIQAWWDEREQLDDERIVLQSLLTDISRLQSRLVRDKRISDFLIESAVKLLQAAADLSQPINEREIDKLIGNLQLTHAGSEWESGPLNSLMMGGDISRISNTKLVQKLADLHTRIKRLQDNWRSESSDFHDYMLPFLRRNANYVQIVVASAGGPGMNPEFKFPELTVSNRRKHSELLSMTEFQGLLVGIIGVQQNSILLVYPQLEESLSEVIGLLEAELRM